MTKLDVIKTLTENGIFDLTREIIGIIDADNAASHASANRNIRLLINSVDKMQNWTLFSWKTMIDLTAQAFGFTKCAAYSDLDVCADVVDQVEELHTILWNNFSNMEIWNG